MCPQNKLGATRIAELEASLTAVRPRLTQQKWEEVKGAWDRIVTDMNDQNRPVPNDGLFIGEEDEPTEEENDEESDEDNQHLFLRPASRVFENT